jgi:hypothetical protein
LPNTVVSDVRYDAAFKRVIASTMGRGVWSIEEPALAACDEDAGIGADGTGGGRGVDGSGSGGFAMQDASRDVAGIEDRATDDAFYERSTIAAGGGAGATGGGGGPSTRDADVDGRGGIGGRGGSSVGGSSAASNGGAGQVSGEDSGCACGVIPRHGGDARGLGVFGLVLALRRRRRARAWVSWGTQVR